MKGLNKFARMLPLDRSILFRTVYPYYVFEFHSRPNAETKEFIVAGRSIYVSVLGDLNNQGVSDSYLKEAVRAMVYNPSNLNPEEIGVIDGKGEVSVSDLLKPILSFLNASHIAEECFNKTRAWLYQRINRNVVNGKPAELTIDQKSDLAEYLRGKAAEMIAVASRLEE